MGAEYSFRPLAGFEGVLTRLSLEAADTSVKREHMGQFKFLGDMRYVRQTAALFHEIERNEVGKIIISSIEATGKRVVFAPTDDDRKEEYGVCNAETHADRRKDAYIKGDSNTLFAGKPYDPEDPDGEDARYEAVDDDFHGTGKGTNVHIFFNPEDDDDSPKILCDRTRPAADFDEVLMHELVHALRDAQGKYDPVPTKDRSYENVEEFLAVVVTNVYLSSKGLHWLRADHGKRHKRLAPSLSTSAGFLTDENNLRVMNKFRKEWIGTFAKLA